MSHITSKNQAEKGSSMPAQPPPPSIAVNEVHTVPGCFTEYEWSCILSREEGEEIVADILDELMNCVMEKCYKLHFKKQLIPFCMDWARNSMIQVIKLQYLSRDEGDSADTISALREDTEPSPSTIDAWAEGCVPVIRVLNFSQEVTSDKPEANVKDLQQKQKSQPKKNTVGKKRSGRTVKLIPASHAKLELERKPHPPQSPSPGGIKFTPKYITVPDILTK
ncbi:uncharacterized protein C2orf81 homolog [Trichomycterus rosablanca]|uniref:uncharacterized protein C2orf81 homolog n=1 Tax=Trichomycterus rosablanca TaxID=2290929 RepID=UPI002F3583EC